VVEFVHEFRKAGEAQGAGRDFTGDVSPVTMSS
jgi:hypothetical protein